jgi:hypothetical protein
MDAVVVCPGRSQIFELRLYCILFAMRSLYESIRDCRTRSRPSLHRFGAFATKIVKMPLSASPCPAFNNWTIAEGIVVKRYVCWRVSPEIVRTVNFW